ncbi:class I SAM-dependent methyltransferase [Chitinimonas lacunae]|uniref:Class I SAM-dependent methyltransferase n=1 Tax=Chitinimonas lacunae TaxID=1963018 RepID=A0ABV8MLA6_9NEIS
MEDRKIHWETVYQTRSAEDVSWYSPCLPTSLRLIGQVASGPQTAILDVGGGAATLVDHLLAAGYQRPGVLDVSAAALQTARQRLAERAAEVDWLAADIVTAALPAARYDIWHDRAVFHFLTDEAERQGYLRQLQHALKPGGHLIMATFGPEGPLRCSGLDVVRYDAASLSACLGERFTLLDSLIESHHTPFGTEQQFFYGLYRLQ